ncbi:DUF2087 domain-containing protein [Lentzea tibetensis]|uniref:DUF2087 domain-containing protein n=1 Tax=Lentzea tibetensis TaxID=2591470 RepID=A0A563EQ70_9PSEU|nr:DUF2087 domain-containing protein [Lentzea tibetensis]TWP49546.1 DUF2087 domain-containing protein [Lentzea tibetensis]
MTSASVVRLLAEPARLRVFAAVALGARTPADVAAATGLSAREVATALQKLMAGELIVDGLAVRDFKELIEREPAAPAGPLHPFVAGDRLVTLPVSFERRRVVLAHVVSRAFSPDVAYTEPEVNEALRAWCDGGEIDHVTVRRYLVDLRLLTRADGVYRLGRVAADETQQPVL